MNWRNVRLGFLGMHVNFGWSGTCKIVVNPAFLEKGYLVCKVLTRVLKLAVLGKGVVFYCDTASFS